MRMPNRREAVEQMLNAHVENLLRPFRDRVAAATMALEASHSEISAKEGEVVLVARHPIYQYRYVMVKSRAAAANLPKLGAEYEAANKALDKERKRLDSAATPVLAQIALTQDYECIAEMLATIK